MRRSIHLFALASMMIIICVPIGAQQQQGSAGAKQPVFGYALYDETASAEEIIRRNPDAMKLNENGVFTIYGKEVQHIIVNGKVIYDKNDTISDLARLLEEITRRVNENNTPVNDTIAHIDDSKQFPNSLPPQYRLPEGMTVEDVIRNLPGVEVLEDGTITVDGKKITNHNFHFPNPGVVDSIVTHKEMESVK